MISRPMVRAVQIVLLSCIEINTISKRTKNELPLDLHYLGVPSGVPKVISMLVVRLARTVHLSCAKIKTISKLIETSFCLTHVT